MKTISVMIAARSTASDTKNTVRLVFAIPELRSSLDLKADCTPGEFGSKPGATLPFGIVRRYGQIVQVPSAVIGYPIVKTPDNGNRINGTTMPTVSPVVYLTLRCGTARPLDPPPLPPFFPNTSFNTTNN